MILNDPGSVEAFTFLQQLWKEGLLARESLFARYDTEVEYLRDGVASVVQNWPITSAELADAGQLEKFFVYPGWHGPSGVAHVIGGDVLGIPKGVGGRHKEAAVELARFLMSRESQKLLARENMWPSFRNDVNPYGDGIRKPKNETFTAMREALKHGWLRPSEGWDEVTKLMNQAVDRILVQGQEVRSVLDDLHGQIPQRQRPQ